MLMCLLCLHKHVSLVDKVGVNLSIIDTFVVWAVLSHRRGCVKG